MALQPNVPMVNLGNLYLQAMQLTWVSTTSITVAAGQARDSTNINDIVLQAPATINAAVNGLNGLDTGALANSSFYCVYAVGASNQSDPTAADPNNPSGSIPIYAAGALLSLSATAPVLPAGFDMFRRIGYVLTDGSAHIREFSQRGNSLSRDMYYANAVATNITAGASTTFAAVTANAVPASGVEIYLEAILTADAAATRTAALKAVSSGSTAGQVFMSSPASTVTTAVLVCPCDALGAVDYLVSNAAAALALNVTGYLDAL